jgi:hypothetical protein
MLLACCFACLLSWSGFHPIIPGMFKPLVYVWRPLMLWMQLVWRQQVRQQHTDLHQQGCFIWRRVTAHMHVIFPRYACGAIHSGKA